MTDIEDTTLRNKERPDHGWANYSEPLWSEILPGLWQGGTADHDTTLTTRARPGIDADDFQFVTTLYAYALPVDWFVKEIRFGVYDSDMEDFNPEEMYEIVRMTHRAWKRGEKTLIRCQAGWNRSGLVMALVLIRDGLSAEEAIALIRAKRSQYALCNQTFVAWLLDLDVTAVRA